MVEVNHGNPPATPGFIDRLRGAAAAQAPTVEDPRPGVVTCQIAPFEAAGDVRSEAAIIEIQGRLDRRTSMRLAEEVDRIRERRPSRVGLITDTRGGAFAGLDAPTAALLELRQQIGEGNLLAFAADVTASGGYLLLATAGRGNIFAGVGVGVGGLGATMRLEDTSRLFAGLLVTAHQLTAGRPDKIAGSLGIEITDEQLAFLQTQTESADRTFLALVSIARGDSIEDVERMAGTGGVFDATAARQIGLIDEIMDERAFRRLVESPETRPREVTMSRTAAGADDAPEITAETPETPAAPAPPEPAAPAPEAGSPPPAAAAPSPDVAALVAAVTAQGQQIETLRSELTAEREARATGQREATVAAFRQRIESRVGNPLTRTAADAAITAVEATVNAGQDAEALVASYEALAPIDSQADLGEEVTFVVENEQVAVDVDFRDFGVVPGPRGEAVVNREGAIETAALIHGAKNEREVVQRLEAAFNKDGRF